MREPVSPPVARAIILWKRDQSLPVDLYIQLRNEGHNVERLEAKYRQS
jgi:hypothetical protein